MKLIGLEEHWCPRELFDREDSPGYAAMAGVRSMFTPEQLESVYKSISDIGEVRIKLMDKLGLSMQILSICNVNMEVLSDEDAIRCSKMSNDILAEGIRRNPGRFRGFAAIPTGVPEEAVKELERCAAMGGFVGAVINGHINGHYLDEPQFDPILAAAERMNMALYIHPAIPPKSVIDTYYKMEDKYAQNVLTTGGWGWHIETGVHVLRLIASGAFDRHPDLKVIVGHLGEGLPFFMERLYNATGGNLKKPYPEYLKENVYYTISGFHDPDLFQYVLKKVGEDHIMFSTDFPFTDPVQEVKFMHQVDICNEIREKIAYKNAVQLLGITQ